MTFDPIEERDATIAALRAEVEELRDEMGRLAEVLADRKTKVAAVEALAVEWERVVGAGISVFAVPHVALRLRAALASVGRTEPEATEFERVAAARLAETECPTPEPRDDGLRSIANPNRV